ncbi:MAG: hypothetical protein ABI767_08255 [Rhodanobacter sp.]
MGSLVTPCGSGDCNKRKSVTSCSIQCHSFLTLFSAIHPSSTDQAAPFALGHPLGATGPVGIASLGQSMRHRKQKYAVFIMCISTDMGGRWRVRGALVG